MISVRRKSCKLLQAIALVSLGAPAMAQMTTNILGPSKAVALGNAVTADTPGVFAIQYNPAGLTKLKGRQFQFNLMNAYMDVDADFIAPPGYEIFGIDGLATDPVTGQQKDWVANNHSHTNTLAVYLPGHGIQQLPKGPGVLPTMGFSINSPGSKFTFGNAFYIPMPVGFYRKESDPGKYMPKATAMQRVTYLSPTVGYEINDEWSVGAGIQFSHQAVAADQWMRAPNMLLGVAEILQDAFNCESGNEPLAPFIALCGGNVGPWDDVGAMSLDLQETLSPTYSLGVLWEPNDWFSWGASYYSEADMHLKGTFELNYTKDWSGFWQGLNGSIIGAISAAILGLPSGAPREAGNVSMRLTYPQHFKSGMSLKVHPKLTVNADVGYYDWSTFKALNLQFDRNLEFLGAAKILSPDNATSNTLSLPLNWTDEWNIGIGLEHHVTSRLDLRVGAEIRDSITPDDQRSLIGVFGDSILWGAGLGYQWDKDSVVDFHISYLQSIEYIPANGSCNLNCDNLTNIIYNPYAGLDVKTSVRFASLGFSFRTKF
ncbi:OmpP1/FadL family transporter [Alkalimarinus sediminis]|uniref:Outer membrane protein transport protein n=1 Tax=Alkalimarinus sediminis TaxID=1632866 RepID=A0A9E8KKR0_9ALTE|nr:outer membrane protein transport protein [Alkalimarinus sediminis]UZW76446.1 outer membrane protein transport protein [Alkalimarinus sediminis]